MDITIRPLRYVSSTPSNPNEVLELPEDDRVAGAHLANNGRYLAGDPITPALVRDDHPQTIKRHLRDA